MTLMTTIRRASGALGVGLLASCNFFDVTNPGPIADENLDTPGAMPGVVTGMAFDLSRAVNIAVQALPIISDELYHGGSYTPEGLFNRGIVRPEDANDLWGNIQRARWVAESGIERMKTVLGQGFATNALSARAYIYAGLANRLAGENLCEAVIDGGPAEDFKVYFTRADANFTQAITI